MSDQTDTHGGPTARELDAVGIPWADVVDFSTNVNPYGPPEAAIAAARGAVHMPGYPDPESWLLREQIAARLDVSPERVVAGNGSAELIWALARVLAPAQTAAIPSPTFGEYGKAWSVAGGSVREIWNGIEAEPWQPAALAAAISASGAAIAFLCAPNNPTGHSVPIDEFARALDGLDRLIVDQAYVNFVDLPKPMPALPDGDGLIVIRSMTKDFGLAGLRLGYVVAPEEIAAKTRRQLPSWNVNAAAQAAGLACLDEADFLDESIGKVREDTKTLVAGLTTLGLSPLESDTHFVLVPVADPPALRKSLLERGVLIRDCASFGLDGYVRLAARPASDVDRLIDALTTLDRPIVSVVEPAR